MPEANFKPTTQQPIQEEAALMPETGLAISAGLVSANDSIQQGFDAALSQNPFVKFALPDAVSSEKSTPSWGVMSDVVFAGMVQVLLLLSPFAIALSWLNWWKNVKDFYYADNKNYLKTMNLAVSTVKALVPTLILVCLIVLSPAIVMYVAPALLAVALTVSMLYGAYMLGRLLQRSYKNFVQKRVEEGYTKLGLMAGITLFASMLALDAIRFVVNWNLSQASAQMQDGANHNDLASTQAGAQTYLDDKRLLEVMTVGTILTSAYFVLRSVVNQCKKAVQFYAHPTAAYQTCKNEAKHKWQALKEFWAEGYLQKFAVLPVLVFEGATLIKNVVLDFVPLLLGLALAAKRHFFPNPHAYQTVPAVELTSTSGVATVSTVEMTKRLELANKMQGKIASLNAKRMTSKNGDKLVMLQILKANLEEKDPELVLPVATVVKHTLKKHPRAFQSWRKEIGEVDALRRENVALENSAPRFRGAT